MILFPILSVIYNKKKKIKKEKRKKERNKKYVNSKIEQIEKLMTRQKRILYENYICNNFIIQKNL